MSKELAWWTKTTIYQIYPRSFQDSTGDGIGDIQGIISRLDYIQELGIETIWFSPFFDSPQGDYGYDVRDYFNIAPEYGTLEDVEELIEVIHKRGMRVLFDLVMNHTSIEHEWFVDSRSSRDNPKRDWYIWRDGRGSRPPNNWKAIPGGSGWHYDDRTGQYYYASFLPFQPDLNFRNPEVKAAMFEVARYWLDKGVDGFRLDIFHSIYKDKDFRDNPLSWRFVPNKDKAGYFQRWKYNINLRETQELAVDLRNYVDRIAREPLLLGELNGDHKTIKGYLGENLDGLNLVFLWELLKVEPNAQFFRDVIQRFERYYPPPYLPVYVFGNHDRRRMLSNLGGDHRLAKLMALIQLTVRGVPVIYYGEEIGMLDGDFPAKLALDPIGQRFRWVPKFLLKALDLSVNRDGCRTPMQWDSSVNAGFSTGNIGRPWLPVGENFKDINVSRQQEDEKSLLNTYRSLLKLRKSSRALIEGTLELIEDNINIGLLSYLRRYNEEEFLILINFGGKAYSYKNKTTCSHFVFGLGIEKSGETKELIIPGHGGLILRN